jgi:hypothetical protein
MGMKMDAVPLSQLLPVIQVAVGPVILVSGISLLLLVLTNRLGRAVDRARALNTELLKTPQNARIKEQIEMLFTRARLVRASIALAGGSLFFAAVLVITLFITALWQLEAGVVVATLFISCMACLICSLIAFLLDVQLALKALAIELGKTGT